MNVRTVKFFAAVRFYLNHENRPKKYLYFHMKIFSKSRVASYEYEMIFVYMVERELFVS